METSLEHKSSEIKKAWAIAEKRQFCKQSCTKISQGLDRLDPRSGDRAIWELLQNARDLAIKDASGNREAHIKITLTNAEFIFAHKGMPFTHDTFGSLVKQVSSQTKENEDAVGQYGTGFLTTHAFGRQLFVSGSLDMEEQVPGKYVSIDKFNIDRTFDSITEFVDKMAGQLLKIDDLADAPKISECKEWTVFSYQLATADNAKEKAKLALETAMTMMPYVMTINGAIGDITLSNEIEGKSVQFTKESLADENGLKVMGIHIQENEHVALKKVYYLQSDSREDIIILPLRDAHTAESLEGIAKLFVFFPLLGTEDFGMDFIFHSQRFYPVEERNGIWLPVENGNVRSKFQSNVKVLNEMTDMLFGYLEQHVGEISNWVAISTLKFETVRNKEDVTNDFFLDFKKKWVNFLQQLPIIPSQIERTSACSGIKVFSSHIVEALELQHGYYFDAVYDVASLVYPLPDKSEILAWSHILDGWYADNDAVFLNCEKLAEGVENEKKGITLQVLHQFDLFIKDNAPDVLNTYALIPNREGELKKRSQIYDAKDIPFWLYDIVKTLIPDDTSSFLDTHFADIGDFTAYSRNDLSKSINDTLVRLRKEYLDKNRCYEEGVQCTLAKLSMVFRNEAPQSVRATAMPLICEHLGESFEVAVLSPIDSDERDIALLPFKHLAENLLLEISTASATWVIEHKDYVHDLHQALHTWNEYFDRNNPDKECLATRYGAYPNSYLTPCRASELKQGEGIPDGLFCLYQAVFNKDLKESLVHEDYYSFWRFPVLQSKDVAKEIEDKLAEDKFENDIILDIIRNIDDVEWSSYFPRIAEKKAELFMKQVDADCKDGIFKLMKIDNPHKLNMLADLAVNNDFEEIIRRGKEALMKEKMTEVDFEYKKRLGQYVEDYIQKILALQLGDQLEGNHIRVENEQYGHDLVIWLNDEPIYFIEVKSRWSTNQSIKMTPLQLQTSVENKTSYALCCVDMTGIDHGIIEIDDYLPVEETINRTKVLTNIGELNEGIYNALRSGSADEIHIDDDYRCIIPQKVIDNNKVDFNELIQCITDIIIKQNSSNL